MVRRQTIRPATAADGERIGFLVRSGGWQIEGIDWSLVAPFWLVADYGGKTVGCLQLALSRPIGYQEMLAVDPAITGFRRTAIMQDLVYAGLAQHQRNGAQMVCGVVPFELKDYKRLLKKRGAVSIACGNVMAKSLLPAVRVSPATIYEAAAE